MTHNHEAGPGTPGALTKKSRRTILIGLIIISSVVAGINCVAAFSIEVIYRVLYSEVHIKTVYAALEGFLGVAYIASFGVPSVLSTYYEWPLIMTAFGRGGERTLATARRRALNSPFMFGVFGATGWISYMAIYFWGLGAHNMPAATMTSLRVVVDTIFAGVMCFVFSYYIAEFGARKYFIEPFFPDGRLSDCEGAFALTIRERFFIYYFSVALFPFVMFFEVFLTMLENYHGKITLGSVTALTAILAFFGAWLTLIVSGSYRTPLMHMRGAADQVGRGDFDIRVPVMSNDETGVLSEAINDMASGLREKEFITDTFGRVVDPSVRDYLLDGHAELGGKIVETTILFTDIRGFTTMSEAMAPDAIVELLNRYFELMGPCVAQENGIVNKFIGDSLMAIFGAPRPLENHAEAAARTALRMADALETLNREITARGYAPISHGVGVHTGPALVGNIGAGSRMEYTAIGDTVNTASRIQGLCKNFKKQIIISETTKNMLDESYRATLLGETEIRGKNATVKLFTLDP